MLAGDQQHLGLGLFTQVASRWHKYCSLYSMCRPFVHRGLRFIGLYLPLFHSQPHSGRHIVCRYSDLEGVRPGPVPPLADGRQGRPTPDNISDNNLLSSVISRLQRRVNHYLSPQIRDVLQRPHEVTVLK